MKPLQSTVATSAFLALLAGACQTAFAAPPGGQLIDQVFQAYRDIQQYDATLHLTMSQVQGRWTSTQQGDYFVAFDRDAGLLQVDAPDQLAVVRDAKLYYRTDRIPGKHLEVDAPNPLSFEWVVEQGQGLSYPALPPDLAFLLADDPLALLSHGAAGSPATVPPDPDDALQRPRIEVAVEEGTMTLTVDPATHLIDQAHVDVNTALLQVPGDVKMTYTFDIEVHSTGQPIAADRFAFDTTNSIAQPNMMQMMASGSNAPHPLTDKDAPPLNLPDIDGNDHDIAVDDAAAQVIVLDFWATWCPPCVAALPELQQVYDWAQAEGKPVAIYAVNQGESVAEVKQFWQDNKLTIPVLMDENFVAAQSYMVNGIPQTVIIAGGKVKQVHVGYAPGIGEQIKSEIQKLLAE